MRNRDIRNKVLEILSETPLVNYACKKVGISRMTFYRWRKDNLDFRTEADRLLSLGRENVGEMAEASLIKNIKDGKMDAIRFFLQNNDPRYMAKRTVYVEPPKTKRMIKSGEICDECGEQKPFPHTFEKMKSFNSHFSYEEYTKDDYNDYLKDFEKNHNHHHSPQRTTGYRKIEKSAYEKDEDDLESN